MNTATNNGFHERQSIEEFLGEHEVVKALYGTLYRKITQVFWGDGDYGFFLRGKSCRCLTMPTTSVCD